MSSAMSHFTFEEEAHRYTMEPGSRPVPSVTQVLDGVGMSPDFSHLDDFYRQRGSAIHRAMALHLAGRLDHDTLDERVRPFVEHGIAWLEMIEAVPRVVEFRWVHTVDEYGGTLDLFADTKLGLMLIDWKSTTMDRSYSVQVVGGYQPLLLEAAEHGAVPVTPDEVRTARIAVVTLKQQAPKVHWCARHSIGVPHRQIFRAALAVMKWREAYGR